MKASQGTLQRRCPLQRFHSHDEAKVEEQRQVRLRLLIRKANELDENECGRVVLDLHLRIPTEAKM